MENIIPVKSEVLPAKTTSALSVIDEKLPDLPAELRSVLAERVKVDWDDLGTAMIELAKGMWIKDYVKDPKTGSYKMDEDGKPVTKVYFQKPDKDMLQYLANQVIGKPKENTVIEGKVNFILDI